MDLPIAVDVADLPARTSSNYPEPFAARMRGRSKRALGDVFGIRSFGMNLTTLEAGAVSALQHVHSRQDEMVYILEGSPTLVTGATETTLSPGMCAGFAAGGISHNLENRTALPVVYLEIGDRNADDEASYPWDDIKAVRDGDCWRFTRKDGTPYPERTA